MKKILVIGAGDYQIPLIKRIVEKGYEAYCVDYNPKAPGFVFATGYRNIDVMDFPKCLQYAKEIGIDAVMTYGATLTLPTVAYLGKELGLPALSMETAELSKNKFKIKQCLFKNGCNIKGNFFAVKSLEEARKCNYQFPCVVKPCDGSGSKGVTLVYKEENLDEAFEYAFSSSRYSDVYVESFIEGEEYSVESFVCNGEIYIYAIVKTTFVKGEDGKIHYGHRTPSGLPVEVEHIIEAEIKKAIKALGINMNSVNFDVIVEKDTGKPYIIDCGIRIGQNLIASHLVPLSRGVSVIDNTIELALGNKIDAKPKKQACVATRLLIYNPGIIREIKNFDDVIDKQTILDVVLRKKVGDELRPYQDKSDTCGWVVTSGNTPDEAEANAEKAKEKLGEYICIK